MKALLAFAATLALAAPALSQSLDALQQSFMAKYDALNQTRDQKLETLTANYSAALKRLLDDTKKSGNLDSVLPIRDELNAVEANTWPLPGLAKTAPRQLVDLRTKFAEARNQLTKEHGTELVSLVNKMQQLLKQKEAELTKNNDVDGALAARKMGETLETDEGVKQARASLVAPPDTTTQSNPSNLPLAKFIPGTVWEYRSGPIGGQMNAGFLLFFKGGKMLCTLPHSGAGTWKVSGDSQIDVTIAPYLTIRYQMSPDRLEINGDDGKAERRGKLHAVPIAR